MTRPPKESERWKKIVQSFADVSVAVLADRLGTGKALPRAGRAPAGGEGSAALRGPNSAEERR